MSRDSKSLGNERLKYGICLNDECSKCKCKEIQSVPMRKELICSECGKDLRECPPPKKKGKSPVALIVIIAVVAVGVGLFFVFEDKDNVIAEESAAELTVIEEVVTTETVVNSIQGGSNDSVIEETTETTVGQKSVSNNPTNETFKVSSSGQLTLSYGKYSGDIKNGYPHGQGRLTYTTTRVINRHDLKAREANSGDYIIGEFHNGYVVYGKLYDANGNLLRSLNFGVSNEDSFESK